MASSPSNKGHVPVFGSDRAPLKGAKAVGKIDPNEMITVTVRVRSRTADKKARAVEEMATQLPAERHVMTREEFEQAHGASPEDLAKVEAFAHEHGLSVVEASPARRTVILSGTVAAISAAFGTELSKYQAHNVTYRGRTGPVKVPADLEPIVEGVFGLDDRPQAKPHFQRFTGNAATAKAATRGGKSGNGPRANGPQALLPTEVAKLYDFPTGGQGEGQTIALIELGGGYRAADIKTYFTKLGLPVPKVSAISVDGRHNKPGSDADGEVMLDILVAGAIAPGAKIAVYFAPNTDQGFLDAITTAIHDKVRKPSVISISWGAAESGWTRQAMESFDKAFQAAATLGVTVCAAAGDNGSTDGAGDSKTHVDFPASSPYAMACGGTRLQGTGSSITQETVWNDGPDSATGGGVSTTFPRPSWQAGAKVPTDKSTGTKGRGLPDIAGDADPNSGYKVRVDGQDEIIGGTSAVAPLWAGLIALMNQQLGAPCGYLNPLLYTRFANTAVCHDITQGDNPDYAARPGWDACTGWGSPDGAKLLAALSGHAPARREAMEMAHAG